MKKIILALFVLTVIMSCKTEEKKEEKSSVKETTTNSSKIDLTNYPEPLQDVFNAHGSLQKWKDMKSMTYTLEDQTTVTDLNSRDIVLETPTHSIGSIDGKVWIAQDSIAFPEAKARFYHNLIFYFYAMPFLLADEGIIYSDAAPLEKDGVSYPGLKIGYEANIGDAPDDNYILYYHPETKQMEWLAYTVTYGKDVASEKFSFIKYNKWQEVNGLLLPEELTWYNVENNLPTTATDKIRKFKKVDVDAAGMDKTTFDKPENGVFVD